MSTLIGADEIGIKTAKDPSQVVMVDNMQHTVNGTSYSLRLMKCDPANLPSG